ncbi:hypothetical protein BH23CHL2_BH23CHL2_21930 [soil metagenome]
MVASRGLSDADTTRLVDYLDQRTSGNPLLAIELLRALETEGTLSMTKDGAWLGNLDDDFLPSFVLQIIERRLDRLDPETRRPLEIAAVIGQKVSLQVWEAVSELDQVALDTAIEQALAAHILEETPDRKALRFTHALIREALYDGVIPTRRRIWHQRTAERLMALPDPDPDAVAFHLDQAGDPRLVDWLIRAGERAERRWAELMAAEQFDRAQLLLEGNPGRAAERAWLLFRTGLLLRHGDHPRSLQRLEEAEAVALTANRPVIVHLARAHQGNVSMFLHDPRRGIDDLRTGIRALEQLDAADRDELERLTASLGTNLAVQGRGTLGMHLAHAGRFREAQALLDDWPESEWKASPDAFIGAGLVHAIQGQPGQARRAFTRSQNMYEAISDPGMAGDIPVNILHYVQLPYVADDVEERRRLIHAAQALMTRDTGVSAPEHQADTLWAHECFLSGDWDRAEDLLHRSTYWGHDFYSSWRLQLARYRGDAATGWDTIRRMLPDGPASEPGVRAYVLISELQPVAIQLALDAGQIDEARSWLEANDRLLAWSGAVLGRSENQRLWARYHLLDGDPDATRRHAIRALEHASDPRQPLALLAAHRFLGQLDTLDGRFTEAEAHLQKALDLATACEAPFERALTLLELARLLDAQHQPDEARQILAEVRAICEPLKAQPTLDQVAALEAALTDQPAETPFGLTPRELDVLRIVAEGLTDPEVAEQLFVSPRTVSSHLTSVYAKLGVSSRAAATRLAVEHSLLSH